MAHFERAFNGQVDMAAAMLWTNTQEREGTERMLHLFDQIKAEPGRYGMQAQAQQNVVVVVDKIKDMVNNFQVFLDAPLPLYYHTKQLDHHTVFDLIGWLFSVCGDIPAGATRSNFYYPLIALFSVFSRLAAGDGNDEPQMVEAAWFTQDVAGRPITRVVIGANLDDNAGERRAEKDITRVARAQLMIDVGIMQANWIDESFVSAPTSSGGGGGGGKRRALAQLFGHCAEALPFLYLESVKDHIPRVNQAEGMALRATEFLNSDPAAPL